MAEEKYILVSLEDEKAELLANILSNKTSKKILDLLAEKELSESEIAKELDSPLNTIGYNIDNLIKAGLIEEKRHLFSVKGKRIPVYKISNKNIVISPKKSRKITGILPVVILAGIFTAFILWYNKFINTARNVADSTIPALQTSIAAAEKVAENTPQVTGNLIHLGVLSWFLIGIWVLVIAFIIITIVRRSK